MLNSENCPHDSVDQQLDLAVALTASIDALFAPSVAVYRPAVGERIADQGYPNPCY